MFKKIYKQTTVPNNIWLVVCVVVDLNLLKREPHVVLQTASSPTKHHTCLCRAKCSGATHLGITGNDITHYPTLCMAYVLGALSLTGGVYLNESQRLLPVVVNVVNQPTKVRFRLLMLLLGILAQPYSFCNKQKTWLQLIIRALRPMATFDGHIRTQHNNNCNNVQWK